ncbi:MAG: membrane protein insertase YidC [Candidatus Zixiibacteriota bacterium]
MDKKSIIIVVILAIIVIFYWPILEKLGLIEPTQPPAPTGDTLSVAPAEAPGVVSPPPTSSSDTTQSAQLMTATADSVKADTLVVQTNKYQITMTTRGGGPISILLKDYTYRDGRLVELIPHADQATLAAAFNSATFSTTALPFVCNLPGGEHSATDRPVEVVYTYSANGATIERRFLFRPDDHAFDLKFSVDQPSRFGFEREYQLGWNTPLEPTEPDLQDDWTSMQAAAMMAGSRETLDGFDDGVLRESIDGQVTWAGVRSKYFASVLIARSRPAEGAYANGREHDVIRSDGGMLKERRITAGLKMPFTAASPIVDSFTVFAGPLDYMMMSEYDVGLQDMLDIGTTPYVGWLIKPFALAIMWILPILYSVVPNYGIVIILFALIVKLITLPLSMRSFKSMQAMKELQPKIEELKKRFPKDPQKLNQEMMKLYKAHGVNPLSGCLPILPQMPLFFALFSVFRSTILLRNAPFVWFIDDLSRGAQSFTDPYIILVVLMVVAQFYSQSLTMATGQQNKMLLYLMPLLMGFIFYKFAAGLVLYWTSFSLLSLVDYFLFRKSKNHEVKTA